MSNHELAQLNIGIIKGPMDSPVMADFAANLDRINALAEGSPGFIWRLKTDEPSAELHVTPGNAGMQQNATVHHVAADDRTRRGIGGVQIQVGFLFARTQ